MEKVNLIEFYFTKYRYAEIGRSFKPTDTDYYVNLFEFSSPVKILGVLRFFALC